ncbi:gas vesicle protein GvpN [Candidatus Bipolaricaulota bacterium]|nr:gas vesicle protein GvpN [Candidatus Bipolaricaulota bacterium]MBS3814178.1 gas vesicle protein GvpN [Candidatus Bipolaricaulota bacterium]
MKREQFYPQPGEDFVSTGEIQRITERSVSYLESDFPVHFAGPTGTGKTTLAMHLASQFDQPAVLVHGDEELNTSDLTGKQNSYSKKKVVDNYIPSVLKTEERINKRWNARILTKACKKGQILIYDEFSRSRPEANNVLLSVLEEGILNLTTKNSNESYVEVHPGFKAIFTSNPSEYAGVYGTQDALLDRMITIDLRNYDLETETKITASKAKIPEEKAKKIVSLTRDLRKSSSSEDHQYTLRSSIKIGKAIKSIEADPTSGDSTFKDICIDVFSQPRKNGYREKRKQKILSKIEETL